MTVVFRRGARRNAAALSLAQSVRPEHLNPEMPITESHLVMAYAYALADLGMWIGHGPTEVSPEDAMRALTDGLRLTRSDAERIRREQSAST